MEQRRLRRERRKKTPEAEEKEFEEKDGELLSKTKNNNQSKFNGSVHFMRSLKLMIHEHFLVHSIATKTCTPASER